MDGGSGDAAAEIFGKPDPIFEQKSLIGVDHVPQFERIVGRDGKIRVLLMQLRLAINDGSPGNVVIYGETGAGRSLITKHASKVTESMVEDVRTGTAHIDCSDDDTKAQAVPYVTRKLNNGD